MVRIKWMMYRLFRNRIVIGTVLTACLFIISAFIAPVPHESSVDLTLDSFNQLGNKENFLNHVDDMHRLQKSIIVELGNLEKRRNSMKRSVDQLVKNHNDANVQLKNMEKELSQIKSDIQNMLLVKDETLKEYASVPLPSKLELSASESNYQSPSSKCSLHTCFDYSRCSVVSGFPIYLYPLATDDNVLLSWKTAITNSRYMTVNPKSACLYLFLYDGNDVDFQSLKYWRGDGRNHVIINVHSKTVLLPRSRAMLAQREFINREISAGFDVFLPYTTVQPLNHNYLPLLLPIRRANLLSFFGRAPTKTGEVEKSFVMALSALHSSSPFTNIVIDCAAEHATCAPSQWCLCRSNVQANAERNSTFIVVPNCQGVSHEQFTYRVYTALVNGAVPVVLGFHYDLPMAEVISWKRAVVVLPLQRVPELVFILRNILEPDIMLYKKEGRKILEEYIMSIEKVATSLVDLLRVRIDIPPLAPHSPKPNQIYGDSNPMPTFEAQPAEVYNEPLGPIEDAFPSPAYQRNFTSWHGYHGDSSTTLFPFTPWDPILPTDAKYHG